MTNSVDSNVTTKLAQGFLKHCQANRVLTKTVDTQLLEGKFNSQSGTTTRFKRPHDYNTIETAGGNISMETKSDIISGYATGTIQNYITVAAEWDNIDEALKLNELDKILEPMARRAVTKLELNLGQFMLNNLGLSYGTPGTAIDAWSDVAGAGAHMESIGVPADSPWFYTINPFTRTGLSDIQNSLYAADDRVRTAWDKATLSENVGGMRVMSSNAMKSRTASTTGDRAGAVASATATYVAHKDTMIQAIAVDGFTGTFTVNAGEIVEVTGKYMLSHATREQIFDAAGNPVKYRGVVTEAATITDGAGTLMVAGPAIYESGGQYNTVDAALADSDVITILGTDAAIYQPALFYHKQACGVGFAKLPKLYSTDTVAKMEDGFTFRVSKYADGDSNVQKVRFDILPAFACFNPFFGGQAYGVA